MPKNSSKGDRKMKKRGRMNKMLSFVLSLVLVLSMTVVSVPNEVEAASASGTVTVSANKTELHRGDEVTVTVGLSGNTNAAGVLVRLSYDKEQLEL